MNPTITTKAIAVLFSLSTLAACSSTGMNATANTSGSNAGATSSVGSGDACAAQYVDGTQPQLTNAKLAPKTRAICFSEYAVLHSGEHARRCGQANT